MKLYRRKILNRLKSYNKEMKSENQKRVFNNRIGVIVEYENLIEFFTHKGFEIEYSSFEKEYNLNKKDPLSTDEINIILQKINEYFVYNIKPDFEFVESITKYLVTRKISEDIFKFSINKTIGVRITIDKNGSIGIYLFSYNDWKIIYDQLVNSKMSIRIDS